MADKYCSNLHSIILIYNLSSKINSSKLRSIFYEYVENSKFICFNYRHRRIEDEIWTKIEFSIEGVKDTRTGLIILYKEDANEFINSYNGIEYDGNKVVIEIIDDKIPKSDEKKKDLFWKLEEFKIPSYLPNGNVGTPTEILMKMISECRMPSSVLRSLKLNCKPISLAVPFNYKLLKKKVKNKSPNTSSDSEDWERYIQFHNDVDAQGRTEERPFESEKEVVWEKGSSGLVHYTDILYWNEKDGKNDFDEDTVDDWDIDVSIYTDPSSADRDSIELLKMRQIIQSSKDGYDHSFSKSISKSKIKNKIDKSNDDYTNFEKYTTGYGTKLLNKYGWVKGRPIGKNGLTVPLEDSHRKPKDKTGLGYFENKKIMFINKPKLEKLAHISTIYDKHDEEQNTALNSAEPTMMKYRSFDKKPKI